MRNKKVIKVFNATVEADPEKETVTVCIGNMRYTMSEEESWHFQEELRELAGRVYEGWKRI